MLNDLLFGEGLSRVLKQDSIHLCPCSVGSPGWTLKTTANFVSLTLFSPAESSFYFTWLVQSCLMWKITFM